MNERDENVGPFVQIRSIAQSIQEHAPGPFSAIAIVHSLCDLALVKLGRTPLVDKKDQSPGPARGRDPKLGLLSAAVHFHLMDLVRSLLAQAPGPGPGRCPFECNGLFQEPVCIAVSSSNLAMLQVIENHTCERCIVLRSIYVFGGRAVAAAAEAGNMDILDLVLRLATDDGDSDTLPDGTPRNHELRRVLDYAKQRSTDPAVFERLALLSRRASEHKLHSDDSPESLGLLLLDCAALGRVDMVRHLVAKGAALYMNIFDCRTRRYALSEACLFDQPGVVDLLLESGLDPGFPYPGFFPDRRDMDKNQFLVARPLACAIRSGNKAVVEKLLGRGARLEDAAFGGHRYLPGLVLAVIREDEPMVRFLLSKGASFDWPVHPRSPFTVGDVALASAVKDGLESMVQLMRHFGYVEVRMDTSKSIRRQY